MYLVKLNGEQIIFDKDYYIHIDGEDYTPFHLNMRHKNTLICI